LTTFAGMMNVLNTHFRILLFCLSTVFSGCAFQSEVADLIVHNGRIHTMDEEMRIVEAVAIRDGRVIETGAERQILNKYRADRYIDCGKRVVYPGFIDAHCHFLSYGIGLGEAQLMGATSFEEVIERMKQHARVHQHGWLIGRGWDQNLWDTESGGVGAVFPNHSELNALFPERPVYLTRVDGHAVLVNQTVLDLAGINPATIVAGGQVEVRDGRCTGILIDNAIQLVEAVMPVRSREEKERALLRAQDECFRVGLTSVSDAGLLRSEVVLIDSLQRAGKLKMRVYAMLSDVPENVEWYCNHGPDTSSEWLTVRSFKFYADGALGSRGACLLSPYEDLLRKHGRREFGFLLDDPAVWRQKFEMLRDLGFQVNTHAIGDSANRVILRLYGEVLGGPNDLRWRVEHAQVVDEAELRYFRDYSIIPSVQPVHATSDMAWAGERLGDSRLAQAYIYRQLKDQLGMIALGTDFPVEDISPFATFTAAVFRVNWYGDPKGGFQVAEQLDPADALRGMTIWAALANKEDHFKGSLEVGKVADLVILDRDLLECGPLDAVQTRVVHTILGGEIVFSGGR